MAELIDGRVAGRTPRWRLTARQASITQGQGAWLFWPTLQVKDVPVLPLPVLYLPLGPRRSGLLAPGFGWSDLRILGSFAAAFGVLTSIPKTNKNPRRTTR